MLSLSGLNGHFLQKLETQSFFSKFDFSSAFRPQERGIITGHGLEMLHTSWKHFLKEKNRHKKVCQRRNFATTVVSAAVLLRGTGHLSASIEEKFWAKFRPRW